MYDFDSDMHTNEFMKYNAKHINNNKKNYYLKSPFKIKK